MKLTCDNCRPARYEVKTLGRFGSEPCQKCEVECSQDGCVAGTVPGNFYVDTSDGQWIRGQD